MPGLLVFALFIVLIAALGTLSLVCLGLSEGYAQEARDHREARS